MRRHEAFPLDSALLQKTGRSQYLLHFWQWTPAVKTILSRGDCRAESWPERVNPRGLREPEVLAEKFSQKDFNAKIAYPADILDSLDW